MRIAIAGAGSMTKYFAQEFPRHGHDVVILTRSHKQWFDGVPGVVAQRTTDYSSVDQLANILSDCDAIISTIVDYSLKFVTTHLALLEACTKSPKCKRFIPSEFGSNFEEDPEFANCNATNAPRHSQPIHKNNNSNCKFNSNCNYTSTSTTRIQARTGAASWSPSRTLNTPALPKTTT